MHSLIFRASGNFSSQLFLQQFRIKSSDESKPISNPSSIFSLINFCATFFSRGALSSRFRPNSTAALYFRCKSYRFENASAIFARRFHLVFHDPMSRMQLENAAVYRLWALLCIKLPLGRTTEPHYAVAYSKDSLFVNNFYLWFIQLQWHFQSGLMASQLHCVCWI